MTAGTITRGSLNSQSYYYRTWSGGDDPVLHRKDNAYTCWIDRKFSIPAVQPADYYHPSPTYWYNLRGPSFDAIHANMAAVSGSTATLAFSRARENLLGHTWNAGVFAAEMGESVRMLLNTCRACFELLRAIGRLDLPGIMRSLARIPGQNIDRSHLTRWDRRKARWEWNDDAATLRKALVAGDVSGVWLAAQYGWLPLISDVQDALQALTVLGKYKRSVEVLGTAKSKPRSFDGRPDGASLSVPVKLEDERVTNSITLLEQLGLLRQLGLDNLATIVWERIPFSFVVDWFIPVGNYLEEFGFWRNTEVVWRQTVFQRSTFSYRAAMSYSGVADYSWGGTHDGSCIHVVRTTGNKISVPLPGFKTLAAAFSTGHLENAAALIHQQVAETATILKSFRRSK